MQTSLYPSTKERFHPNYHSMEAKSKQRCFRDKRTPQRSFDSLRKRIEESLVWRLPLAPSVRPHVHAREGENPQGCGGKVLPLSSCFSVLAFLLPAPRFTLPASRSLPLTHGRTPIKPKSWKERTVKRSIPAKTRRSKNTIRAATAVYMQCAETGGYFSLILEISRKKLAVIA